MKTHAPSFGVQTFGSGSSGNATLVKSPAGALLVDAGIGFETIQKNLLEAGVRPESLDAILLTHTHGDHLGCACKLSRYFKIPVFASEPAAKSHAVLSRLKRLHRFEPGETLQIGGFSVETLPLFHDAQGTVALVVERGGTRFGIVSDLGRTTRALAQLFASCDGALIEFNHCEALLRDGIYPWRLKRRVLSEEGHLSNEQAAGLLLQILQLQNEQPAGTRKMTHVWLGHLSEKNNNPDLALGSARAAAADAGRADLCIRVAPRSVPGVALEF